MAIVSRKKIRIFKVREKDGRMEADSGSSLGAARI